MPPKKKCWTKPRIPKSKGGAGGTYTTCEEGQKKKTSKSKPKEKMKVVIKKKTDPGNKTMASIEKKAKNKMDPAKLFGTLPVELRKMILLPSQRGGGVKLTSIKGKIDSMTHGMEDKSRFNNKPVKIPKYASFKNWLKGMGVKESEVNDSNIGQLGREYRIRISNAFHDQRKYWEGQSHKDYIANQSGRWDTHFSPSTKSFIQKMVK